MPQPNVAASSASQPPARRGRIKAAWPSTPQFSQPPARRGRNTSGFQLLGIVSHPAAAYAWHVASGGVLVVVDLDRDGWRSVTHDAAGIVHDLAELQPDLLNRVPLIAYRDSMGQWDALRVSSKGTFAGFAPIGATSEAEAVAWVMARHG